MTATETTTLAAWLLARIAEDEAVARAATNGPWWYSMAVGIFAAPSQRGPVSSWVTDHNGIGVEDQKHIARHDPARVLAECAAKRAIVGFHEQWMGDERWCHVCIAKWIGGEEGVPEPWPCPTLRALASAYADSPGWREDWR